MPLVMMYSLHDFPVCQKTFLQIIMFESKLDVIILRHLLYRLIIFLVDLL